ncbi:MAG: AAA family ATPase [Planctomycetota bacterium]|jgi:predicted kinase
MMELIIFTGLQAAGKTTFYSTRFFDSHVRINLDMLKTRHRERLLFEACLSAKQKLVIDNTNPTAADRRRYIRPARDVGFKVIGHYFAADLDACKARNRSRPWEQVVPLPGLLGTYNRLEQPSRDEGFDEIYYVKATQDGAFMVEAWRDEV